MADPNEPLNSISIVNSQHDLPELIDIKSLNEKLQLLEAENKSLNTTIEFDQEKSNEEVFDISFSLEPIEWP